MIKKHTLSMMLISLLHIHFFEINENLSKTNRNESFQMTSSDFHSIYLDKSILVQLAESDDTLEH